MQALNEAMEGASEFSDFMRKSLEQQQDAAQEAVYQSEKRPGENREMYRARMKQLRRSTIR